MNGEIKEFKLVKDINQLKFYDECKKVIHDYQSKNLYVEIQYSSSYNNNIYETQYSAMILGRTQ